MMENGSANLDGFQLVWSDEFDYSGLPDPRKWSWHVEANNWVHDERHNEVQWYMAERLENARVEDGRLKITARRESWLGEPFTSARIRTKDKGDWMYGRVEVRAKLPAGRRGTWPAIWLMPTDKVYGNWPMSGEIDIMECVGFEPGRVHASIHTGAFNHRIKTHKTGTLDVPTAHEDFHVYAVEWDATSLRFFVDGHFHFEFRKSDESPDHWPFDQRFHLILNVAVGGNWAGLQGIDADAFPVTFEIDYVRVYQRPHLLLPPPPPDYTECSLVLPPPPPQDDDAVSIETRP